MERIQLFSHNDMDGYGADILLKASINEGDRLDVYHLSYNNADNIITHFMYAESYKAYDKVFITDLSLSEDTIRLINNRIDKCHFIFIDHHPQSCELAKTYKWMIAETKYSDLEGDNTCGTQLLYEYLCETSNDSIREKLKKFYPIVDCIRKYDTFSFKYVYHEETPKHLNILFGYLGGDKFVDSVIASQYIKPIDLKHHIIFDKEEKGLVAKLKTEERNVLCTFMNKYKDVLECKLKDMKDYCERKNKLYSSQLLHFGNKIYNVGIIYADIYINDVSDFILEHHKGLDLIFVINMDSNKISVRTIKDNIPCNLIAKYYNGGGHPQASGFGFGFDDKFNVSQILLGSNLIVQQ